MTYKILIIDDEMDLRMVLSMRLLNAGYEVAEAENGMKGLDVALKEKPDLVILDLHMPVMNGYETWRNFKKNKELQDVPILVLTCERQSDDKYWGQRMPHADFITKPYEDELLLERIREKIEVKEKIEALTHKESPSDKEGDS